ncbi:MAG: hypothetical protein AB7O96_06270 [Pseudobdellovibrionaceae bacterium]
MKTFFFIWALLFTMSGYANTEFCTGLPFEAEKTIRFLKRLTNTQIWTNYRPTEQIYILAKPSSHPRCVLVIESGHIIATLITEYELTPFMFTPYISGNEQLDPVDPAIAKFLETIRHRMAMLYDLDFDMTKLDPDNRTEEDIAQNGLASQWQETLVHEAVHIYIQADTKFAWPGWASESKTERDKINPTCYRPNAEIEALSKQERSSLLLAYQLAAQNRQHKAAHKEIKNFIQLRTSRYLKLQSGFNCQESENIMELYEGVAEYIGVASALAAGSKSIIDVQNYIRYNNKFEESDFFYRTALLQLLLIKEFYPDQFIAITQSLSTSSSPEFGIFYEFKRLFDSG